MEHSGTTHTKSNEDKQKLTEILLEAAQDLGQSRMVEESVWQEMVERQQLGQRSLESKVVLSGPISHFRQRLSS